MLVNPEVHHLIQQATRTEQKKKSRPSITRGAQVNANVAEQGAKPRSLYEGEKQKSNTEVDYLNERHSNLNFYA